MTVYDQGIFRSEIAQPTRDARELPVEVGREVIQAAVQFSNVLQLAKVQPMPARQATMPVLTSYPTAVWLTGANQAAKDKAVKQTTGVNWSQYVLRAEELAIQVPIPDSFVADTGIDLFNEIKPLLGEAFGVAIDNAALFDINNPWTTSGGIYQQAVAAGNTVTVGAATDPQTGQPQDLAQDIADVAILLEEDGYSLDGLAAGPGFNWRLTKLRSKQGDPIYAPPAGNQPATIYGQPYHGVKNGTWDKTKATMIAGEWEYARVGIRQDLTMQVFDQGVITDNTGAVIYNAISQDGKILRAVMRIAFLVAAPAITRLNQTNPYPFAVLRPSGAPAS